MIMERERCIGADSDCNLDFGMDGLKFCNWLGKSTICGLLDLATSPAGQQYHICVGGEHISGTDLS